MKDNKRVKVLVKVLKITYDQSPEIQKVMMRSMFLDYMAHFFAYTRIQTQKYSFRK